MISSSRALMTFVLFLRRTVLHLSRRSNEPPMNMPFIVVRRQARGRLRPPPPTTAVIGQPLPKTSCERRTKFSSTLTKMVSILRIGMKEWPRRFANCSVLIAHSLPLVKTSVRARGVVEVPSLHTRWRRSDSGQQDPYNAHSLVMRGYRLTGNR